METEGRRREVVVSSLQFACSDDISTNVAAAERLVREAHAKGANIILIQELFEGYYFCQAQREDFFKRAKPYKNHPTIARCDIAYPISNAVKWNLDVSMYYLVF
jgi:N-carbamoylputrescine amidase